MALPSVIVPLSAHLGRLRAPISLGERISFRWDSQAFLAHTNSSWGLPRRFPAYQSEGGPMPFYSPPPTPVSFQHTLHSFLQGDGLPWRDVLTEDQIAQAAADEGMAF